jgi:hypothetical protein
MAALRENHRRQVVVGVLGLLGCVALLAIAAGPAPRRSVADLHRIDAFAPSTDSLHHHSPPTSLLSFFLLCFLAALTRRLAAQSSRATMIPRLTRSAPPACLCRACAPACVVMHPPRHDGSDLPLDHRCTPTTTTMTATTTTTRALLQGKFFAACLITNYNPAMTSIRC